MSHTVTHLYDTYDEATRAVRALEDAGIAHSDISIVGSDAGGVMPMTGADAGPAPVVDERAEHAVAGAGTGASLGTVLGGGAGLLAGIGALAIPGVGPVVAAGWLIATLTGAGAGAAAGGLLGSLTGHGVPEEHAHVYAEGVRRGGTLVSVRVADDDAARVETLLAGTGRVDVAQRGADYRAAGWERFDESTTPARAMEAARHSSPGSEFTPPPATPSPVTPGPMTPSPGTASPGTASPLQVETERARAGTHA